ncbi:MAG: hypothetical protein V1792_20330 [Pseudomonadota bacterium]
MKRILVGLVCVLVILPVGGAYGQNTYVETGGLCDLVFDVMTAPMDLLGHLCGQGAGAYPEGCVPVVCVPDGSRTSRSVRSGSGASATTYRTSRQGISYVDCRPRTPEPRYVSRRVSAPRDCPDCPPRQDPPQNRPKLVAKLSPDGGLKAKQPEPEQIILKVENRQETRSPREIVIRVEQASRPAEEPVVRVVSARETTSPREIVIRVEQEQASRPEPEPVVKVVTIPEKKSPREIIIRIEQEKADRPVPQPVAKVETKPVPAPEPEAKVETKPLPAPEKEAIIRVETKEAPAVMTPKEAPPEPAVEPEKPKKKKKVEGYRGCSPYGGYYYWGPGGIR